MLTKLFDIYACGRFLKWGEMNEGAPEQLGSAWLVVASEVMQSDCELNDALGNLAVGIGLQSPDLFKVLVAFKILPLVKLLYRQQELIEFLGRHVSF